MTDSFQSGAHPDADQLNAFVEGVLPEHERRESLAHLAACERCRQIVFLAQSAQPPAPVPASAVATERSRKPGWFGPLAWFGYAGAAFACTLLVFFALRGHRAPAPPAPNLVARVRTPSAPVVVVAPPSQAAQIAATPTASSTTPKLPAASAGSLRPASPPPMRLSEASKSSALAFSAMAGQASPRSGLAGSAIHGAAQRGRINASGFTSAGSLGTASGSESRRGSGAGSGSGVGSGSGIGSGDGVMGGIAGTANGREALHTTRSRNSAPLPQDSISSAAAMAPSAPAKMPAMPAPPLSTVEGLPVNGRQSVNNAAAAENRTMTTAVASPAPGVQETTLDATALAALTNLPVRKPTIHPLPSKLPSIARVTSAGHALAVDSAGNLFFSKNAGKRWKRVRPLWHGKVVQLALAAPAALTSGLALPKSGKAQPASGKSQPTSDQVMAAEAALAIAKASAGARPFELVTASGARWVSTDGLHWRPE